MDDMSSKVSEYDVVDRPDEATYLEIIQRSMAAEHCTDPECIVDVNYLASFFYKQKDFSMRAGEVALVEKQFVFDKAWKPLKDWFSDDAYIRGTIDILEYNKQDHVTLTDYKSGRKMLNEDQLRADNQMKTYVLFIHKFLPSVTTITVRHHYIRFGKIIQYDIGNIDQLAKEAEAWITESISEIEREILKKDGFPTRRNQHCSSCFLAESNRCPLFNVKNINDIDDPASFVIKTVDDLRKAWKKIEVNDMENKNLTTKCKQFISECHSKISIDKEAILDFWTEEATVYDPLATTKLFVKKNIPLDVILPYMSMSETAVEKILKKTKIEVSADELKLITEKKVKTKFTALTKDEVEGAGYLNA
jgi:hypothetical protein